MFKIIVNNKTIDYLDSSKFPFTLSKDSIFDQLNTRSGERSYTVELPNTFNNRDILDINSEQNSNYKYYSTKIYNYKVLENSIPFSEGILKITSVQKDTISVNFLGNSISWVALIGKKKLKDIESFADYPFSGMLEVIDNTNAYISNTDNHINNYDVIFPLIAYGNYFLHWNYEANKYIDSTNYLELLTGDEIFPSYTSSQGGDDVAGPLIAGTVQDVPNLQFEDIPPAYYLVNILIKIFEDIEWSVSGSWISKSETLKLILPTTGLKDVGYNWGTLGYYSFTKTDPANVYLSPFPPGDGEIQIIGGVTQAGSPTGQDEYAINYVTLTSKTSRELNFFVVDGALIGTNPRVYGDVYIPEDGIYQIDWRIAGQLYAAPANLLPSYRDVYPLIGIFPIETTTQLDLIESVSQTVFLPIPAFVMNPWASKVLYDLDTPVDTWSTIYWTPSNIAQNIPFDESKSFRAELKKGQLLRIMYIAQEQLNGLGLATTNSFLTELSFSIQNLTGDIDFKIAKNLPDIQQIELISSLITMFNLKFESNSENKIIYFEQLEDYFVNSLINTPINSSELTEELNSVASKYNFSYNTDSQDHLINLELEFNNLIVSTVYATQDDEQEINCKLSDTRMQIFDIVKNTANQAPIRTFANLSNPRFVSTEQINLPMISDTEHYNSPQYGEDYKPWNYKYNTRILKLGDPHILTNGLPIVFGPTFFDLTFQYNWVSANFDGLGWSDLYNAQYYNWILNLQLGHQVTVAVYLDSNTYNAIQTNVLIKLNNVLYYLKKLENFNPAKKQKTNLVLIKRV